MKLENRQKTPAQGMAGINASVEAQEIGTILTKTLYTRRSKSV